MNTKKFSNLEKFLLTSVALLGGLMLFVPMEYLAIGLVAIIVITYLLLNPKICLYLIIFTIPFVERIRILPISFSANDIAVVIGISATIINMLATRHRVSLRTSIDKWNIAFLTLYLISGITSLSPTGILTTFKFLEAILVYYMIIYLVRTKQLHISEIIKAFIYTALFQAIVGILQSTTGQFGAEFQSQRGILGYLGIGSKTVWHAWGTFGGNGALPEFLVLMILLLFPLYKYFRKNKANKILWIILFMAVYMGYSKESMLTLTVCLIFYYNATAENVKNAIFRTSLVVIPILILVLILKNTAYMETVTNTVDDRFLIWKYPIYALTHNVKYLVFGSGLNSYWELIDPYLEPYIFEQAHTAMLAHNYFLLSVQEFGLIGAGMLFSFFILTAKKFFHRFKTYKGYYRWINLSGCLVLITIFTSSVGGQFYYHTFSKILIYVALGLIFSKEIYFNKMTKQRGVNV